MLANVVGVEHGVFRCLAQALRTVGHDVRQRADKHPEIAVEHADATDGLRAIVVQPKGAVGLGDHNRRRKERLQDLLAGHWARTRSASAVWGRESLVQVEVHHVGAEITGTHLADQSVHVGAVHVEQRALGVQQVGDLVDLLLEDAQGVGIGEHERGNVIVHLRF